MTIWQPDTCACILEVDWDADHPVLPILHSYVLKCPAHQALSDDNALAAVSEENQVRKMLVFWLLAQDNMKIKSSDFTVSYDAQRVLELDLKGAPQSKKNKIQGILNSVLGPNKAKVK